VEEVPTSLVADGKLKDPTDMADAFNRITKKLNIQQIAKEVLYQF
jgi:Tfp pilus assembly PilM family ATPase